MHDTPPLEIEIRAWLEQVVIGLNLCPFARPVVRQKRLRIRVSDASTEEQVLRDLHAELLLLAESEPAALETTLLALPRVLKDFAAFNQFLDLVDLLLEHSGMAQTFQVASFHPGYQFADTEPDAAGNLTNRAPVALLHVLRQESVTAAIESVSDVAEIPLRNIATMESMDPTRRRQLFPWLYRSEAEE